jgi:hypothetical protein
MLTALQGDALAIPALADDLMALMFKLFTGPAFMKLFDAGHDWAHNREEFRSAIVQRTARTLMIHRPNLSKESVADIALVILLNVKTVEAHQHCSTPRLLAPRMNFVTWRVSIYKADWGKKGISS